MTLEITMPRLSDTMESGKVLQWLKKEGEEVKKGEPLVEIETDKANMELEAFENGKLEKIVVKEGQSVPIGQLIAVLQTDMEEGTPSVESAKPNAAPPRPVEVSQEEAGAAERRKISPLARRIAEEHGLDLQDVKGTGPGSRITKEDVEGVLYKDKAKTAPPPAAQPQQPQVGEASAQAAPQAVAPVPSGATLVELTRMQSTVGKRMTASKTTVPHFYVTSEVNMSSALDLRKRLNSSLEPSPDVSINDLIVKAIAVALTRFPQVNASYRDGHLEMHKYVNIGVATAINDGLVVPILHDCDRKSLKEIAIEGKQLYARARSGKLLPDDFEGGTFSISNLGMYEVDEFSAIINPPQSGILAVGTVRKRPAVVDDQVAIADLMRLTLSVDHRVYFGSTAAEFLQTVKRILENPLNLLI